MYADSLPTLPPTLCSNACETWSIAPRKSGFGSSHYVEFGIPGGIDKMLILDAAAMEVLVSKADGILFHR